MSFSSASLLSWGSWKGTGHLSFLDEKNFFINPTFSLSFLPFLSFLSYFFLLSSDRIFTWQWSRRKRRNFTRTSKRKSALSLIRERVCWVGSLGLWWKVAADFRTWLSLIFCMCVFEFNFSNCLQSQGNILFNFHPLPTFSLYHSQHCQRRSGHYSVGLHQPIRKMNKIPFLSLYNPSALLPNYTSQSSASLFLSHLSFRLDAFSFSFSDGFFRWVFAWILSQNLRSKFAE